MPSTVVNPGLEGVVVGETVLSNVEGQIGRLTYRGYDIHDLASNVGFEEVVHLLFYGALPAQAELEALHRSLAAQGALPESTLAILRAIPRDAWPMDVLRTAISSLSHVLPNDPTGAHASGVDAAFPLVAKTSTIVAAWDRLRRGLDPIAPRPDLKHAANFLYMRTGEEPTPEQERALDTYFVLLADHSFNASTFAARVVASTNADLYCAVTAAVATLTGQLHGGAPSGVMDTLEAIVEPDRAEQYVRDLLARGKRVMGIGHREYKIRDPRAQHLDAEAKELAQQVDSRWYELAVALEQASNKVLQEAKPDRKLYANVDFYTAPLLADLGLPKDEFTCVFACSRVAGWSAHVLEQYSHNRLIRPQATYVGPQIHALEPLAQRAASNGQATLRRSSRARDSTSG
jgi:citrate synthase